MQVLGDLPVIEPGTRVADAYARVHASLTQHSTPIATMDLLIGCTALNGDAALLTANRAHFSRIVGMRVLSY
ncbi:hypothetical protein BCF74_11781 [Knoellia remsis]|uniref:PIN domain-containing protein n=2 Tax=Knoellia remsis TaxID=407159 RepID=A0A2T0UGU0_9MICO|nr:hypothetical protein BCF74_11781 [Knoellia remsis]